MNWWKWLDLTQTRSTPGFEHQNLSGLEVNLITPKEAKLSFLNYMSSKASYCQSVKGSTRIRPMVQ